jgi:uncharacterized membrane protein YGL010W
VKSARTWLDEYSLSHRNAVNRKLHFVCIPVIVFSLMCAFKAIPLGGDALNAASVGLVAALAYYALLSWRLALGLLAVLAVFYAGVLLLQSALPFHLIWAAAGLFIAGWIGQFVGHVVERARPSFFKDLQFLLIGPMWELAQVYEAMGIAVEARPAGEAPAA